MNNKVETEPVRKKRKKDEPNESIEKNRNKLRRLKMAKETKMKALVIKHEKEKKALNEKYDTLIRIQENKLNSMIANESTKQFCESCFDPIDGSKCKNCDECKSNICRNCEIKCKGPQISHHAYAGIGCDGGECYQSELVWCSKCAKQEFCESQCGAYCCSGCYDSHLDNCECWKGSSD